MATPILIIGETGTGKSTSIRTLNPSDTYIINVINKPLPFPGAKHMYVKKIGGNYTSTDSYDRIISILNGISSERIDIKNIVIDDFQYIMGNEFMRRAEEKKFDKFAEIGKHGWEVLEEIMQNLRDDLFIFVLSHSEETNRGTFKCKTVGNMLDKHICLESMFTIILHSLYVDGSYLFLTNMTETHQAKSPMGMFKDKLVANDLAAIKKTAEDYFDNDKLVGNSIVQNTQNNVDELAKIYQEVSACLGNEVIAQINSEHPVLSKEVFL